MWRMRKSIRRKWAIGILFCLLQCAGFVGCYTAVRYTTLRKYAALLAEKDKIVQQARRSVYITRTGVSVGEVFTEENTEQKTVLSEQNPEGLETEVLGKIACADLPAGSIISKAVCCTSDVSATERECVLRNVKNTDYFSEGAVVELRIRYDNGENYCVIKKKRIGKKEDETDVCRLYLTEEEQLLLSAARCDVQSYDGAELYMVGFREERIQTEACCEYLPPVQVMTQLRTWTEEYENNFRQIQEQRTALEERLTEYQRRKRDSL